MMSLAIATHMASRRREDGRLHRLLRRLRRRLVPRVHEDRRGRRACTIVANERYARTDTSVTGQVLKIVAAKPDAVLIAALGHAGRAAAADAQGARLRRQVLPDARRRQQRLPARRRQGRRRHLPAVGPGAGRRRSCRRPIRCRTSALEYVAKYEAAYGKGSVSTFGAHAWDAGLLMAVAAAQALKKAQPGTPEFRAALRDALENAARGARRARHLQHVADRPPRPRPARPRDGQDRERRLEIPTLRMSPCRPHDAAEPDRRPLGRRASRRPRSPAPSTAARSTTPTPSESTSARRCVSRARRGVPALLALDFQQRAARLKALAAYLNERKEKLYAISHHTGATRSDSWVDIEGGTGTLYAYAVDRQRRAAVGQRGARRPGDRARQEGPLRRHPHPGAARRRRGAHQRLQLPGLGPAREVRADLPRRHAVHRQAGDLDQLPDRGAGAPDDRVGPAARGQPAARDRRHRRPARPARELRRRHLHRLGRHRGEAARQPQPHRASRSRSTPRPIRSTARSSRPT